MNFYFGRIENAKIELYERKWKPFWNWFHLVLSYLPLSTWSSCSSLILQIWVLEERTTSSMDLQRRRRATAIADTVKHAYLLFLLRSSDYFSRTWPIRCQGNVTRWGLHGWRISTTKSHYYTQVRETSFLAFRIEDNRIAMTQMWGGDCRVVGDFQDQITKEIEERFLLRLLPCEWNEKSYTELCIPLLVYIMYLHSIWKTPVIFL